MLIYPMEGILGSIYFMWLNCMASISSFTGKQSK
jgi:hypothetical protein